MHLRTTPLTPYHGVKKVFYFPKLFGKKITEEFSFSK
jgi:hypothetical protein